MSGGFLYFLPHPADGRGVREWLDRNLAASGGQFTTPIVKTRERGESSVGLFVILK